VRRWLAGAALVLTDSSTSAFNSCALIFAFHSTLTQSVWHERNDDEDEDALFMLTNDAGVTSVAERACSAMTPLSSIQHMGQERSNVSVTVSDAIGTLTLNVGGDAECKGHVHIL